MASPVAVRLVANGEALIAETSRSFNAIKANAKTVAQETGRLFSEDLQRGMREAEATARASFKSIQDIVASATRTNGAVQFDVAGAQHAAAAAQDRLAKLQAIATAYDGVIAKEGQATAATLAYAAAIQQSINEEQQNVAILNNKAATLEKLQAELGQTAVAQSRVTASAGEQRAGMQQLSFQISDVATSFASGINPMVIFAQQGSQVIQSIGMMRAGAGGLIGFLAGPWGAAIMGAVTVLGMLWASKKDNAQASEELAAAEKAGRDATQSVLEAKANLDRALGRNTESYRAARQAALNSALADLASAAASVQASQIRMKAAIQEKRTLFNLNAAGFRGSAGLLSLFGYGNIDGAVSEANKATTALKSATATVINARAQLISETNKKVGGDGAGRGGSSRSSGTSPATKSAEETTRALEQQEAAYKRISDQISRDLLTQQTISAVEALRAQGREQEAEELQAITSIRERYGDLLSGEPELAAKVLGITAEQVKLERERLRILEDRAIADVDKKFTDKLAAANDNIGLLPGIDAAVNAWEEGMTNAAREQEDTLRDLANFYERAFRTGGKSIWRDFKEQGLAVLAQIAAQQTMSLLTTGKVSGNVLASLNSGAGGGFGGAIGGLLGGLSKIFKGGSAAAGAAGAASGAAGAASGAAGAASGAAGAMGAISSALPYAAIALSLAGPLMSMLGPTKRGSATLSFSNGELGVGSTRGNSQSRIQASKEGVNSLADMLNQIAESLGGKIGGAGSVSVGVRKNTFVVDTTGQGRTKGAGVLRFKDENEAIEAAVRDALKDGVINGISDAAKAILQKGGDLQKAISKAAMIESIPKALKARMNPVGAALDELNAKWDKTIAALKEGGASAAQMAEAEKLYRLEREDALKAANDNLKDFINSLNFGSSSTYGLIDQQAKARAELDRYLGKINSGDFAGVDQQKYLSIAQQYLDITREIDGSGRSWFSNVDELRNATQRLADGLSSTTAEAARDPFAETTATNTAATAANTQATAEILAQHSALLSSINQQLQALGTGGGINGFIGTNRNFVDAA